MWFRVGYVVEYEDLASRWASSGSEKSGFSTSRLIFPTNTGKNLSVGHC